MPLILGTNSVKDTGFDVANSCRFNDDDSAYMHKTPGGAGNRRKFTISAWVKRGQVTTNSFIFSAWTADNDAGHFAFGFESAERLTVDTYSTNLLTTNRVFRDPSAWYHVVCAIDTENDTANNRVRLYVNGVEETSFATRNNPTEDVDLQANNAVIQAVGTNYYNSQGNVFYDGYMAEFCMIDNQQLTPTSFGEFDDSGIWKPIDVSGLTFGTNGFYLDFEASGNLGNDANGGTDFTEVSLAATDQTTDTCTNNFATLNAIGNVYGHTYSGTFSNGNLSYATSGRESIAFGTMETVSSSSNGFYFEIKCGTLDSNRTYIGLIDPSYSSTNSNGGLQNFNEKAVINSSGEYFNTANGTSVVATYTSFSANDIIMVAYKNGSIWFGKNGTWMNSGNPSTAANAIDTNINTDRTWLPSIGYNSAFDANFGSPPFAISSGNTDGNGYGNFEYAVPSSYYSLNTKNLAEYG